MMKNKIDRAFQREILWKLYDVFPHRYSFPEYDRNTPEYEKLLINLYYLQQHGLIDEKSVIVTKSNTEDGKTTLISNFVEINHRGIDFLLEDGGLSAILGVVTIKFEEQQLREILEQQIRQSDLPEQKKSDLLQHIQNVGIDVLKDIFKQFIKDGLKNIQQLF